MSIYDCIMYFNEDLILDLRLNILDKYVDKFVIVEGTRDHSGKEKKLNFNKSNFKKFEKKIIYHVVEDIPKTVQNYKKGWSPNFYRENFHRNAISKPIEKCEPNDLILISDADEIPNFESIKNNKIKKFALLSQRNFYYKLNLQSNNDWLGTGICYKKYLKSPQWLRNKRFLRRGFIRKLFFKTQIISNGGWHFSFLKKPKEIVEKMKSYGHGELNYKADLEIIENSINEKKFFLDEKIKLNTVNIDETYPDYISENQSMLKDWIL